MSKRILIIGAGAIGLSVATILANLGIAVTLLTRRREVYHKIESEGISLNGILGEYIIQKDQIKITCEFDQESAGYDVIIIATKAYDLGNLMCQMRSVRHIFRQGIIILFQNGIGTSEIIAECFERKRIYNACVFSGFQRQDNNKAAIITHAKPIAIGNIYCDSSFSKQAIEFCTILSEGGLPTVYDTNIETLLLEKLVFNAAVNPISAICSQTIGQGSIPKAG